MNSYIGTKRLNAKPMSRGDYNKLQKWEIPVDENPDDAGYLVEYVDGGEPNHVDYQGYISWSPKDVFEKSYVLTYEGYSFGDTVMFMKQGKKVARIGWNGKGMYLTYKPGYPNGVEANKAHSETHGCEVGDTIIYDPYIEMKTATGSFVPWLASQSDILSDDWVIID